MTKKSKWKVSIDDGYIEFQYTINISDKECIVSVYEKIRKLFKARRRKGKIREAKP